MRTVKQPAHSLIPRKPIIAVTNIALIIRKFHMLKGKHCIKAAMSYSTETVLYSWEPEEV